MADEGRPPLDVRALRRAAAARTFDEPCALERALERPGFVQADPIRAPARAQDLILRQRVVDYRAGDLERRYPSLPVVEEMLHVYGFLHRRHRALLHPRRIARRWHVEDEHPRLRRALLEHLATHGASHPRDVERALVARRVLHPERTGIVNAWGGRSSAATRMLEVLHHRGLLHVVRRERGVRVYALASSTANELTTTMTPRQRADGLVMLLVDCYAPLPRSSLVELVRMLHDRALPRVEMHDRIAALTKRGRLRTWVVDGVAYVDDGSTAIDEGTHEPRVRLLAPFDPYVWDRRRFAHCFGWDYRFEAYTRAAKRRFGYYALPLLWDDGDDVDVIGWANVARRAGSGAARLSIEAGFAKANPRGPRFRDALVAEFERLERFVEPELDSD